MILRLFLLFGLFCAWAMPAQASTRDKLHQVESKLSEQKEKAAALDEKAKQASADLQDLRRKLVRATAALQAKENEQSQLEDKLARLGDEVAAKAKTLDTEKRKLSLITDALIELSRVPPESSLLQTDLTTEHIHRAIVLRAVLPRLRAQTDVVARDLKSLNDLQVRMAEQKHLVIAAQDNLEGQQHDLDQLIRARQGMLNRTEAQKESIARQLAALSGEATDLRQLLERLTPKERHRRPERPLNSKLRPPVAGTVVHGFGAKDAAGVVSQGVTYSTLSGSPVVAPAAGKVVFEGPFRGYGQILILQHDGGYHSFLAGFGRIDADMGEEVSAGEPLGVMPVKSGQRPELYFEWRHDNEPVDPAGEIALSKRR